MKKRILLVEPEYKNKYPPLGLMKISTYHKARGDHVCFVKGCISDVRSEKWDRVYVSTLFTFYWHMTVRTIKYYTKGVPSPQDVFVGGVMATLLADDIERETQAKVVKGLVDRRGLLDKGDRHIVDRLVPDYSILDEIEYKYPLGDAYLGYATKGCPNRCAFCAVSKIEPVFVDYLPIRKQVSGIKKLYGPKQDLVLLDNNVLASNELDRIVGEVIDLGFAKGAKLGARQRILDFNQGIDARLLTRKKMASLAKTAIRPMRIAFDHIAMQDRYIECVKMANEFCIPNLSNYVLYNYTDTPKDFYERLRINVELNQELGTKIFSFPMKYIPLNAKNRRYVGKHWTRKLLRGVQCILLATRGKVGANLEFFKAAFGQSPEEFIKIAMMPEHYIIYRERHKYNGAYDWNRLYDVLGPNQRTEFFEIVGTNSVRRSDIVRAPSGRLKRILRHYTEASSQGPS
jgi:hypothetical protein